MKKVVINKTEILSDEWYTYKKVTFKLTTPDEQEITQVREVLDRGNGAVILLYNAAAQTVILTKQFRLPAFLNGHPSGMLIEACAGLLDEDEPDECIKRETMEETGYAITDVQKVFEAYMSPGVVTEILHFYIAAYEPNMRLGEGGGVEEEQEFIEVLEYPYEQALAMIANGEIKDAKTIMLLQYLRVHQLL